MSHGESNSSSSEALRTGYADLLDTFVFNNRLVLISIAIGIYCVGAILYVADFYDSFARAKPIPWTLLPLALSLPFAVAAIYGLLTFRWWGYVTALAFLFYSLLLNCGGLIKGTAGSGVAILISIGALSYLLTSRVYKFFQLCRDKKLP